ncbi:1-phosphofructokinase [Acinetobacter sp. WU_MDCI_Axc73]|nr:1-phosphofructokinase [Acinetobacter sp. WU_MDCI_Axc73]
MAKILAITLNPAIDVTIELDTLHLGAVNRQKNVEIHAAGKGLNVAQVLCDLGHQIIVSGFLGQNNREIFDQHFNNMQFEHHFVYLDDETRQNIKLAENSGRMTDINGQGFYVNDIAKNLLLTTLERLCKEVDFIVIAGSLPKGFEPDDLKALINLFKQQNKKVAVDTSGKALVAAISANPWMIKPNTDELEESYGQAVTTLNEQVLFFNALKSNIQHIVISMGEQGVHWIQSGTTPLKAIPPKVLVKSTVGAGDSLLAGMIHGIANHDTPEEILRTATAIASHAVSQIGFRVPPQVQLEHLKQNTVIKTLSPSDAS